MKSGLEIGFMVSSAVSSLVGCLVVLTVYTFPMMRQRLFMKIIVNISICDIIASIASAFGFPSRHSPLCPLQGFMVPFFYKAGWIWTVLLAYQLYSVVIHSQFGMSMKWMHLLCWSATSLSTLLPLTTNAYGRDDDQDLGWCFISGNSVSAGVWGLFTFNLMLLVCTLFIVYFLFRIYWRYRSMNIKETYPEVYAIIDLLILYPPGFFLSWGPNLIMSVAFNFDAVERTDYNIMIFDAVTILATQSGTIVTIIFFMKSKEARYRWQKKLSEIFHWEVRPSDAIRESDAGSPVDFKDEASYERTIKAELNVGRAGTLSDDYEKKPPTVSFMHQDTKTSDSGSLATNSKPTSPSTSYSGGSTNISSPRSLSNSAFGARLNSTGQQSVFSDEDDIARDSALVSTDLEGGEQHWQSYAFRTNSMY